MKPITLNNSKLIKDEAASKFCHVRKIIKEILLPLAFILIITGVVLMLKGKVMAADSTGGDIFQPLRNIGDQTKLPSYNTNAHPQSSYASGASNITSAVYYAVDFVKYGLGTIAFVTMIISGLRLITAGKNIDQVAEKQKEHFKNGLIGLLVVIVADQFIKGVFFGEQGEVFSSQGQLQLAAEAGSEKVKGLYNVFEYLAGALAILMLVISGFRLIVAGGNEEVEGKAKKTITYAVLGLILLGLSEFVVKDLLFPKQGSTLPDIENTKLLIVKLTNFVSGFLSIVSALMFIYGGGLYVTSFGNDDGTGKAKKVMLGAAVGLFIAMGAFAVVNTTVKLEPTSGVGAAGNMSPASLPTNPIK